MFHKMKLLLCVILMLCLQLPAYAKVRALVIGIDNYQHGTSLKGAVNDALDISDALSRNSVSDLTLLINEEATYSKIKNSWHKMLDRSNAGDLLIFTYAGHGSQEPEHVEGSEKDDKDEVLLLGGFKPTGTSVRERIVDNEFNEWVSKAEGKDIDVLVVIDSCHSGNFNKPIDKRVGNRPVRSQDYVIEDEELAEIDALLSSANINENDLPFATFIFAGTESEKIPEHIIENDNGIKQFRGALSYVFSRLLDGRSNDNNNIITRRELYKYVNSNVKLIAESSQTPNGIPNTEIEKNILEIIGHEAIDSTSLNEKYKENVDFHITNYAGNNANFIMQRLTNVSYASEAERADLVYDAQSHQVISGFGDVVANNILNVNQLQKIVDKEIGMKLLKNRGLDNSVEIKLGKNKLYCEGQFVDISVDPEGVKNIIIFNLAGDGTVQYLGEQTLSGRSKVKKPFGADHLFAITSNNSLHVLSKTIQRLDGKNASHQAIEAVLKAQDKDKVRVGVQGIYTTMDTSKCNY